MTENKKGLRKIGVRTILRIPLFIILTAVILFVSAGRIDIPRAWIYIGMISIYYPIIMAIMYRINPELIIQRARGIRKDTKSWDKVLMPAAVLIVYIQLAIIGLDVGRFQWSNLGIHFTVPGVILYIIAAFFGSWAVITNPHFEPTVRIQKERDHQVITKGPYKIVRHPGYLVTILFPISISFIIGSVIGLIPAAINILLIIIRTYLEDKTLINELDGYSEYAKKTKYRLFPRIW
ncbi:MAG: isoprenylcysteine carboxylmethyltransferase family protein [Candidatus Bathyarchaeota archaeon]|nr:isoprenylcysteine carboxylmethyltransferase family protein [Candidatus Bathyarchaeota archaeon]